MSSKKIKVATSVASLIDVIKTQLKNNIIEKSSELNLDRENIEKICMIMDASITNTFVNGVESILKNVD